MSRSKKVHRYLAFQIRPHEDIERTKVHIWDMLRYDACFPVTIPDGMREAGWFVVCQPWRDGHPGGFTLARWDSLGVRRPIIGTSPVTVSIAVPYEMLAEMEQRTR